MFKNKKDEENNDEKKYPEVVVGSLIIDKNNNILLAKNRKWDAMYTIFGGHVEKGETLKEAVLREAKEETGLDVEVVAELGFGDSVFHKDFKGNRHFVFIDFLCRYEGDHDDVELEKREYHEGEFVWVTIEEAKKMKIAEGTKQIIERYEEYLKSQNSLEGWKRCQADFDNYRKMQDESKKQFKDFMLEDIALQILPVVDNFQMSLQHVPEDQEKNSWVQGILHIQHQLETILKDNGIEEIKTKVGDEFDPNFHEAISHETHNMEHGTKKDIQNKIAKIVSKGYRIGDKVIRAVKVVVE